MKVIGIIAEYNPFHLGHWKQLRLVRQVAGEDCGIAVLMSGSFVQRGAPAIFDKSLRARAAVECGADLVLELPVNYALASAEGFCSGGVRVLSGFCDGLCFGTESGDLNTLNAVASALLSGDFSPALHRELESGKSFPAARQAALAGVGADASLLEKPNDILAVEYCKAILAQHSTMQPMPIRREGSYHADVPDKSNPSATALRGRIESQEPWMDYVPRNAREVFSGAAIHTLAAGERAMLGRLRCMEDAEFAALPYGSEGLWRKFMHQCRTGQTLEEILTQTKSRRYTRSRLDRMAMCAYLGLTQSAMDTPAPYTRVLAFNGTGREILKMARRSGRFPHVGEPQPEAFWDLEQRCTDLYGLFCVDAPEPAGLEAKRRVWMPGK